MGKATIVSGGEDGLYQIRVELDQTKIDDSKTKLKNLQKALVSELAAAEREVSNAQDIVDGLAAEIDDIIDSIAADAQCEPCGDMWKWGAQGDCIFPSLEECNKSTTQEQITRWMTEHLTSLAQASKDLQFAKSNVAVIKAQQISVDKELGYLSSLSTGYSINSWCVDPTQDLKGHVGTIEVPGELHAPGGAPKSRIMIRPGGGRSDGAAHDPARDGESRLPMGDSGAGSAWNWAMQAGWEKWHPRYRTGTLTAVDTQALMVDVTLDACSSLLDGLDVNRFPSFSGVPVDYVCGIDAFEVGDHVVIEFRNLAKLQTDENWSNPYLIGFVREPESCCNPQIVCDDATYSKVAIFKDPPEYSTAVPDYWIDWVSGSCWKTIIMNGPQQRYGPVSGDIRISSATVYTMANNMRIYDQDGTNYGPDTPSEVSANLVGFLGAGADNSTDVIVITFEDDANNKSPAFVAYRLTPKDPGPGFDWTEVARLADWYPQQMMFFSPDGTKAIGLGYEWRDLDDTEWNQLILFDANVGDFRTEAVSTSLYTSASNYKAADAGYYVTCDGQQPCSDPDPPPIEYFRDETITQSFSRVIAADYGVNGQRMLLRHVMNQTYTNSYENLHETNSYRSSSTVGSATISVDGGDIPGLPYTEQRNEQWYIDYPWPDDPEYTSSISTRYIDIIGMDMRHGKCVYLERRYDELKTDAGSFSRNFENTSVIRAVVNGASKVTETESDSGVESWTPPTQGPPCVAGGWWEGCDWVKTESESKFYLAPSFSSIWGPFKRLESTTGFSGNQYPGRLVATGGKEKGHLYSFQVDNLANYEFQTLACLNGLSYGPLGDWNLFAGESGDRITDIGLGVVVRQ